MLVTPVQDQDVAIIKIDSLFQNLHSLAISSAKPNNGDVVSYMVIQY